MFYSMFSVSAAHPPLPYLTSSLANANTPYSSGQKGAKEEGCEAAECEQCGKLLDKTGTFVNCHDALVRMRACVYEGTSSIEAILISF